MNGRTRLNKLLKRFGYNLQKSYSGQPNGVDLFEDLMVKPVSTLVDIGCHKGNFIKQYLERDSKATCYGFEPDPENYGAVRKRFEWQNEIQIENIALSNQCGKMKFNKYEGDESTLSSLLEMSHNSFIHTQNTISQISIEVSTLDEYFAKKSLNKISCLKIDTQGNDLNVLKGGENLLQNQTIENIIIEINFFSLYENQADVSDIFSFLKEYRYHFMNFYNIRRNSSGAILFADGYFKKSDDEHICKSSTAEI